MKAWIGDKFRDKFVVPNPGRTLIVGSLLNGEREDRRASFEWSVGLDMQDGPGVDIVHDLEKPYGTAQFEHVECVSVLEHCRKPWKVAANIEKLMSRGATIFLSVPFVWRWHGYPSDYFRYTADGVRILFPKIDWITMRYGSTALKRHPYLKAEGPDHAVTLPRCEIMGFGRRK